MYRELKNRNGEAKPVEGLYTKENVLSIGQEERTRKKRRKFATDFDLIDKTTPDNDDDPNFLPNKSPWLFLIALEAMLRTFCKAGSYMVKDHATAKPVMNVDRIPVEEHLGMARKFVLEWMNRRSPPKKHAVIRQLARIDLHIRRRWWRNYIDNPTWSFTHAIQATESLADNQWSFDYSTSLYHSSYQGVAQASPRKPWKEPNTPHTPNGGGKTTAKGKGGAGRGGKSATGKGTAKVNLTLKIGACTHNGQRVNNAKSKNGEWFCTYFNVRNNCRNNAGSCSAGSHRCNILISPTKVCNGNHSAKDHTGSNVPAGQ